MPREIVMQQEGRPYCLGTRSGNLVFVSGQLGWDEDMKPVSDDVGVQMGKVMDWIKKILAEAGGTLDDIVMVNVYMSDLNRDYAAMNDVYCQYMGKTNLPARATVEVQRLALDLKVEVSCIAALS